MRTAVFALLAVAAAAPIRAQSGAFIIRLGRDTTAVERFTRSGNRIEAELVWRQPRTNMRRIVYELAPDGRPTRITMSAFRPGTAPGDTVPYERGMMNVTRDSVLGEVRRDTSVTQQRAAAPAGFVPVFNGANASFIAYELVAEKLHRATGQDSISVPIVQGNAGRTWRAGRINRDSIWIYDANNRFLARVDRDGHILGAQAVSGTQQFSVERVASADVWALGRAFAARDAQQQGLGTLSTRDTVRATTRGAELWIDYGRPAKRGRDVFGSTVVPWGEVWRTGANAATQFRTDKALEIGGVVLQPGMYTLWTVPSQGGWQLRINTQTGQWGTAYDATKDIFWVPMSTATLNQPVERFTISLVPAASGGTLQMEWDRMRAFIPFIVRN